MKDPDVQSGLEKLGFQYQANVIFEGIERPRKIEMWPNLVHDEVSISLPDVNAYYSVFILI